MNQPLGAFVRIVHQIERSITNFPCLCVYELIKKLVPLFCSIKCQLIYLQQELLNCALRAERITNLQFSIIYATLKIYGRGFCLFYFKVVL